MPAAVPTVPERLPRRARHLLPPGLPRRAEILAALALAGLLTGVLFAQLTLVLGVAFHAFGRLTRLRPSWLLVPASGGAVATLAVGPERALAGLAATPRRVLAVLAQIPAHPLRTGLAAVPGSIGRTAGGQLPLALVLAAGLAAMAWWARWLRTDEWDLPACRPGLVSLGRQWWTGAFIRAGGIVTRDGAALGTDLRTGRAAAVGWREAAGGVLVTGAAPAAVGGSAFQIAHAAIGRRTPVVVVDLAGDPRLPGALAAACAKAGAPLLTFGRRGPGCYEPLRDTAPDRAAGLVMGMADWDGVPGPALRACRDCLVTALTVLAAAPAGAAGAMLDALAALLRPGALAAALARVPGWHPGTGALAEAAGTAERWLAEDPATARLLAGQLTALRASEFGRWLGPAPHPGARIGLDELIRERAVALFSLGRAGGGARADGGARVVGDAGPGGRAGTHGSAGPGGWAGSGGPVAAVIARLVALDLASGYAEMHRCGIAPDGLAWFSHGGAAGPDGLPGLTDTGTGLVPVLSTASPAAAAELADRVNVVVAHRLADRRLAARLAGLTGTRFVAAAGEAPVSSVGVPAPVSRAEVPGEPPAPLGMMRAFAVPGELLCDLAENEFVLITGGNGTRGRAVSPAWPR